MANAIAALRQHRAQQAEERLRLAASWTNDLDLVFVDEVGKPIEARKFLRNSFKPPLKAAGLPDIRFHDLRHSAATLLLGRGIHPKIVSEMLGHSQGGITLDLYSQRGTDEAARSNRRDGSHRQRTARQ